MNHIHLSSSCLLLLLLLHLFCTAAGGEHHSVIRLPTDGQIGPEWVSETYRQRLDHFSYTPERDSEFFHQRYFINTRYWNHSGWNGRPPIIVYTGGEWNINVSLVGDDFPMHVAFSVGALVVYMEHRYYGESNPFGSHDGAYMNSSTLGYLSAAQALADFAEITMHVTKSYCPIEACPVIAMGCSYGGMVAAWFRLKYPHLVVGALASSAPVLFPNGKVVSRPGFYDTMSRVFRDVSQLCYDTIKASWAALDHYANIVDIRVFQSFFNICDPSDGVAKLKYFLYLMYLRMTQYDDPRYPKPERFCWGVTNAPTADVLDRLKAGLDEYYKNQPCLNLTITDYNPTVGLNNRMMELSPGNTTGWGWQTCTEMIFPIGSHGNITMFETFYYDYPKVRDECWKKNRVMPRPQYIPTTFNISSHLDGFAGNIIFSNGLRDPFSSEGVLSDISSTIIALVTQRGAHCTDMNAPHLDDPQWLKDQRKREMSIMEGWIMNYIP